MLRAAAARRWCLARLNPRTGTHAPSRAPTRVPGLELAECAIANPNLLALCEHYDILDKIVLHDDPTGWRLWLHVFLPGYFDRPYNHRWTYSSRILHGSYTHSLYGTDDQLGDSDDIDVAERQPRMVRTESAGDLYTLR